MPGSNHRFSVNLDWLIKLRWVAVAGQLITITGAVVGVGIPITLWPLAVVIGLTVISNFLLMFWFARVTTSHYNEATWNLILGLVMTMDMLSLTTLLFTTGGPTNPFCLFFFVNLSLSAVVLHRNWAWGLNLLAIVCYLWLMFQHVSVPQLNLGIALMPIRESGVVSLPQIGLLLAFATCSSVIVYFMTRLTGELRQQEIDLRLAQQQQARSEKLEALGTLAAGAAHELSTPLTTIALVAKDVEQVLKQQTMDGHISADVIEDVGLIRGLLDRCKRILDRMASHAGETVGEMMQRISVGQLWEEVIEELESADDVAVQFTGNCQNRTLSVPVDALSQALRGLVQNALDASATNHSVEVTISDHGSVTEWEIRDIGSGMSDDVLKRVSEPFFTTKQPGKGMGLGVFLAKNVVDRLGGSVRIESTPGKGTKVNVVLPRTANPSLRTPEIDLVESIETATEKENSGRR